MAITLELFPETVAKTERAKPRTMMHVCDAGDCIAMYRCAKCGAETKWLPFDTITEAKRGVPCETCNQG